MKKIKLFNFRLPFAIALSLICGIISALFMYKANAPTFAYFTAVPITAVIFIITALFTDGIKPMVCVIAVFLAFMIGLGYANLKIKSYETSEVTQGTTYMVGGNVTDVGQTSKGTEYIVISDAYAGGIKLKGNLIAYLTDTSGDYCTIGYKVTFYGAVYKYDLFAYGDVNYRVNDDVKYYCTAIYSISATKQFFPFTTVRSWIYATLFNNLDSETASVAYAMLTGNTGEMSQKTLSSFRYGGISHIFAVSGLHIGIIFGALTLLFKKFHINKYVNIAIKLVAILFYAGVCGFSPSSVRAVIMCAVMALSKLFYQKYDSLNSLSVAVIILLLVNPLYLFGIGFILSVSAVLGIILLNYNFSIILSRLPWSLRNSLSVTLSAQITTIPALLLSFGYISVAGLLLNIIIIPIMSFLFVIILVATLLCTIVPLCGFVLPIVCLPLQVIINLAVHIGFEKAVVSGFGGWWLVVIALFIIIAISDKFNIKKLARLVIMSVTVCAFTFVSIFQSIMPINSARVIASAYYNGGVVIIKTHEGAVLVVTEDLNTNKLSTTLNKYGVTDLSSVIILGGDECLEIYFDLGLTASNIYLSQDLIGIESVGTNTIYFVTDFSIYGVDYKFYDSYSIVASYDGVRVGISAGEYQNIPNVDLLFSVYECEYQKAHTTYYFNRVNDITSQNNIYDCGDLQFAIKNGTIK